MRAQMRDCKKRDCNIDRVHKRERKRSHGGLQLVFKFWEKVPYEEKGGNI